MKRIAAFTVLFIILLLPGCQDEPICTRDLVSRVRAGFYVRDAAGQRDTLLGNFTFYGALRPDSLLYDASQGLGWIVFPLPQVPEEYTDFVMGTDSLADTLRIHHSSRQELVSFSCGFATVHNIDGLEYGSRIIDTVSISDSWVDLTEHENLKIYIRPAVADTAG